MRECKNLIHVGEIYNKVWDRVRVEVSREVRIGVPIRIVDVEELVQDEVGEETERWEWIESISDLNWAGKRR